MSGDSSALSDHATEVVAVIRHSDEGIDGISAGDAYGSVDLPTTVDAEGEVVAAFGRPDEGLDSMNGQHADEVLGEPFPIKPATPVPLNFPMPSVTLTPAMDLSLYPSNELCSPQCFLAASQATAIGSIEVSTPTLLTLTSSLPGPTTIHTPAMIMSSMQLPVLAAPPLPAVHVNTCDQPPVLPSLYDCLSQPPQPIQNTMATVLHGRLSAQQSTSSHQPFCTTTSQPADQPTRKRGKKWGPKKTRGGLRGSIFKQFGKPFWDLVDNITDEEYATLSVTQQQFITSKIADRKLKSNQRGGDDTSG